MSWNNGPTMRGVGWGSRSTRSLATRAPLVNKPRTQASGRPAVAKGRATPQARQAKR
jgi:hypothetical protein